MRDAGDAPNPLPCQCFFRVSIPFTLPRQVSPAYGTTIESVPIDADPLSVTTQDVRPGALALPVAVQSIELGVFSVPWAVPVNFKSPGQVALNEPFAAIEVCSVTFHLKSVQVLGVGTIVDDVQLPTSELLPATDGSVNELWWSKPAHPAAAEATTVNTNRRIRFFIGFIQ